MSDAYALDIELKEKIDLNKLIDFLISKKHKIKKEIDKAYNAIILKVDFKTKREFLITSMGKRLSLAHMENYQKDDLELKKFFKEILNFIKKEYHIKEMKEWMGHEHPYNWILEKNEK